MSKQVSDKVKANVRAVLISSPSGVKQTKFCREYETLFNGRIEWRNMGFSDLYEFLLAIPDVARVEYSPKDSQNLVFGVLKNDVYSSVHAKKAGKKGTGEKPRPPSEWGKPSAKKQNDKGRTIDVGNDLSSLKVTVPNAVKGHVLVQNELGLYGVHIKNLPNLCTEKELELVFKEYKSLKLCKIVVKDSSTFAFVKFKNEEDALRALSEKSGYNLRGFKLKLGKANEALPKGGKQKGSQGEKEQNFPTLPKPPLLPDPKPLVPVSVPAVPVVPGHAVVVNNVGVISEIELMQIYSKYGMVQHVEKHGKSASLSFSSEKEALATLNNMSNLSIEGHKLTLSPQRVPSQSNMFFNVPDHRSQSNVINHIEDAGSSRDLSRSGSTTATFSSALGDRSTTSSSSKESNFSSNRGTALPTQNPGRSETISNREGSNLQHQHHKPQKTQNSHQQQHQEYRQQSQPQEQHQGAQHHHQPQDPQQQQQQQQQQQLQQLPHQQQRQHQQHQQQSPQHQQLHQQQSQEQQLQHKLRPAQLQQPPQQEQQQPQHMQRPAQQQQPPQQEQQLQHKQRPAQQQQQPQHKQRPAQQQQQPHQQQRPQQHQQQLPQSSTIISPLDRNIHLLLNKDEMEKLCYAFDHPLTQRLQSVPDEMDVLITEVVDACHFWAIIDSKTGNWHKLESLEKQLQISPIKKSTSPQKYTIGAGKFTENNLWYRCFVLDVSRDQKSLKVLYTDYGNAEWIPLERFMSLDSLYQSLPPQAHAFHLAGLEVNISNSKEIQLEGAKYLRDLIGDKTFVAKRKMPVDVTQGHILEVELFSKSPGSSPPYECINKRLGATKYVNKINSPIPNPLNASPSALVPIEESKQNTQGLPAGQFIKLKISWVQNPQHVYYHEVSPKAMDILESINKALDRIPIADVYNCPSVDGIACFVSRTYGRKRVKILESPSNYGDKLMVKVKSLDLGNQVTAEAKSLLKMPASLRSIAPCAHEAILAELALPRQFDMWPKAAIDLLISYKEQVLDAEIIKTKNKTQYLKLYNSKGECINTKIMETLATKDSKELKPMCTSNSATSSGMVKELGPAPFSTKAVPPLLHIQQSASGVRQAGSPQENSTSKNNVKTCKNKKDLAQTSQQKSPNSMSHAVNDQPLESQSRGPTDSNADFYMPPPPCTSKEIHHKPQVNHLSSKMGVALGNSPIPRNVGTMTSSPYGTTHTQTHGQQASQKMGMPMDSSPMTNSRGGLLDNKPFEQMGVAASGSQIAQNGGVFPPSTVTSSMNFNQELSRAPTNIPPNHGLNQPNNYNEQWQKEREALLARRKEQERYIEKLSKEEVPRPSTQNLQQLKEKLAKQVRIKELENQVLKLRKEIESLEAKKADIQYKLIN